MVSIVDLFSVLLLLLNQALCKDWLKSGWTPQSFSESCSHLSGKNQTHIRVKRWYSEFIKTPAQRRVKGGSRGRIEPLIVVLSLFEIKYDWESYGPIDCHLTCFFWHVIFYLYCNILWIQSKTSRLDASHFLARGATTVLWHTIKTKQSGRNSWISVMTNSGIYKVYKRCVKTDAWL